MRGWDLCTADISKAFLQGVTYEELAKLTGEPVREVNFWLPPSNIPLLRKVPGFETFDPTKEVLHCDKPGTGLVDAPRAFNMKLKMITRDKLGFASSSTDAEFCTTYTRGELACLLAIHVDDLKIAGEPAIVKQVLTALQTELGEMKIIWHDFTAVCSTFKTFALRRSLWIKFRTLKIYVHLLLPS